MVLKLNNKGVSMYEIVAVTFIVTLFFITVISVFSHMTISTKTNHDRTFAINDADHTYIYLSKVPHLSVNVDLGSVLDDTEPYIAISDNRNHEDPETICVLPDEDLCRKAFMLDDDTANKREVYFYSYSNQSNINTLSNSLDSNSSLKKYLEDLSITDGAESRNYIRLSIVIYYDDSSNIVNHYLWEVI